MSIHTLPQVNFKRFGDPSLVKHIRESDLFRICERVLTGLQTPDVLFNQKLGCYTAFTTFHCYGGIDVGKVAMAISKANETAKPRLGSNVYYIENPKGGIDAHFCLREDMPRSGGDEVGAYLKPALKAVREQLAEQLGQTNTRQNRWVQ